MNLHDERLRQIEKNLQEVQAHVQNLVKQCYESCEAAAKKYEQTINGKKYVQSSNYKMHIRGLKTQVLNKLKDIYDRTGYKHWKRNDGCS